MTCSPTCSHKTFCAVNEKKCFNCFIFEYTFPVSLVFLFKKNTTVLANHILQWWKWDDELWSLNCLLKVHPVCHCVKKLFLVLQWKGSCAEHWMMDVCFQFSSSLMHANPEIWVLVEKFQLILFFCWPKHHHQTQLKANVPQTNATLWRFRSASFYGLKSIRVKTLKIA